MMQVPSIKDVELGGGRKIRVRSWPGHGRPLVLLHGLLDDSMGWAQLAADTHRPCLAMDLPGFGGSCSPSRPRISAYAEAVCAAIEEMGIDDCTLVGHSLGGAVATAVAERCREVQSLVLLAPAGFGHIRLAEAIALPGVRDVAQLALPLGLVNPLVITGAYSTFVAHRRLPSKDLVDRLRRRAWQSGPGVRAAVQAISAAGRSERGFTKRRVAFDGPVAALWGEHDALVSTEHARAVKHALPQASIEVWRGMGHHPQRERPHELNAFIERQAWLARRSLSRRIGRAA
ncbi:MAG TPA: alpha/beta fold hydrolase [Baekduia sp.]|nr:alpha/beta fold hydrolase [Baekduia sp.]